MTMVHSAQEGSIPTEQAALSVADILDRAADLIEPEGAWIQGDWALDAEGNAAGYHGGVCWCADGAILQVAHSIPGGPDEAWEAFTDAVGVSLIGFNDAPGRTQAEVVAALRAAAEKARQAVAP